MLSDTEMIGRLLLAALLGSLVGLERERISWAAGLRTHMLVCVGACLIIIVSAFGFADILDTPHVVLDPSRIAAQVVSGIGFLGAGAIMMRAEMVRGLTTAASVWAVAAIGLSVGSGLYTTAISATVIILLILAGIKPIEEHYKHKRHRWALHVRAVRGTLTMERLQETLGVPLSSIKQCVIAPVDGAEEDVAHIVFSRTQSRHVAPMIERLKALPAVHEVRREEVR